MRIIDEVENHTGKIGQVQWFDEPFFPRGKAICVQGREGLGKSSLLCDYAARLTRGDGKGLHGSLPKRPVAVLVVTTEDDFLDTYKPKFLAAGGDETKLHFIERVEDEEDGKTITRPLRFPTDWAELAAFVKKHEIEFVVFDPLNAHLDSAVDGNGDQGMRTGFWTAANYWARKLRVTIVAVFHLNKRSGVSLGERTMGARANSAAARVVLTFERSTYPGHEGILVYGVSKSNLGAADVGVRAFRIMPTLWVKPESMRGPKRIRTIETQKVDLDETDARRPIHVYVEAADHPLKPTRLARALEEGPDLDWQILLAVYHASEKGREPASTNAEFYQRVHQATGASESTIRRRIILLCKSSARAGPAPLRRIGKRAVKLTPFGLTGLTERLAEIAGTEGAGIGNGAEGASAEDFAPELGRTPGGASEGVEP